MTTTAGQSRTTREIHARSGGRCEIHPHHQATDRAHRQARSAGGTWTPTNVLHLCRACHAWCHNHPEHAAAGGWMSSAWQDPASVPVWLHRQDTGPGWYLLVDADDGGPHLVVAAEVDAATAPLLPPTATPDCPTKLGDVI